MTLLKRIVIILELFLILVGGCGVPSTGWDADAELLDAEQGVRIEPKQPIDLESLAPEPIFAPYH